MAFDEGLAQLMRDDLVDVENIDEKRMFGGLAFLMSGNMVCGVHKDGAMFRVGKIRMDDALSLHGAGPMTFTGKAMGGMVDVSDDAMVDDALRQQFLYMALENARSLPPK